MKRYRRLIFLLIPAFFLITTPVFASRVAILRDAKDSTNPIFDVKKVRIGTDNKYLNFYIEEYEGTGTLVENDNGRSKGLSAVFNINCDNNPTTGWVNSTWNALGAEYQLAFIAKKYKIGSDKYVLQNVLLEEWNNGGFVTQGMLDRLIKNGQIVGEVISGEKFKNRFSFGSEEAEVSIKLTALQKCTAKTLKITGAGPGFITDSPTDYFPELGKPELEVSYK